MKKPLLPTVFILILVASFFGRSLYGTLLLNIGELKLYRSSTRGPSAQALRPFFWGTGIKSGLQAPREILSRQPQLPSYDDRGSSMSGVVLQSASLLQSVLRYLPKHPTAAEVLARSYLALGESSEARKLLSEIAVQNPQNPLLYVLLGDANDRLQEPEAAIEWYDRAPSSNRREALLANYLTLAERAQSKADSQAWLIKAFNVDPSNLQVLFKLYQTARELNHSSDSERYRRRLQFFSRDSIRLPTDPRLLSGIQTVVPSLVEENIWSSNVVTRVISFWGETGDIEYVHELIEQLSLTTVADPRLLYLHGKAHEYSGELREAEYSYRRAIELESSYAPAYNAIAALYAATGHPERAIDYYRTSYSLSGDLLALKNLGYICRTNLHYECLDMWEDELSRRTDDTAIVSDLLAVSESSVMLGPNLLSDETVDFTWRWAPMFSSEVQNEALFVGWSDMSENPFRERTLHILGFWKSENPDLEPARAGFWGPELVLESGQLYVLSFLYKTEGMRGGHASVFLSYNSDVLFWGDRQLPHTNGVWRKYLILGYNNSANPVKIHPLFRTFGIGDVWFRVPVLRQILLPTNVQVPETIFELR